jgi:hypothetical protein
LKIYIHEDNLQLVLSGCKRFLGIAVEVDEMNDLLEYLVLGEGGEYVVQVGDPNFFLQN